MSSTAGCTPDVIVIVRLVGMALQVMTCSKPRHSKLGWAKSYS